MARKHVLYSYKLFDADSPVTATSESSETNVAQADYSSIDLNWANSDLTASAEVQVKNGKDNDWRALDFGASITISGASGSHEIIMTQMPFTHLRVAITVTGGTSGDVNAILTTKSEGA